MSVNSFRLNKRQERHAVLMLNAVPELAKMRFKLCPKMMTEERFWFAIFLMKFMYKENLFRINEE